MDEGLEFFLEKFGVGFDRREVPDALMEKYGGKLPQKLLEYWTEYGWCGYAGGLFWTVNPQDYDPVVAAFLTGTRFETEDVYHVIAKGAFGDLYLWGESTGDCLCIAAHLNHYSYDQDALKPRLEPRAVELFLRFCRLRIMTLRTTSKRPVKSLVL